MVVTVALLWLLASLDAAFCGYRAAAGRSRLIRKQAYYRRAMARGLAWGQAGLAIAACVTTAALRAASHPETLRAALGTAGERMVAVYGPYALAVGVGLLLRAVPSVDVRSIASTALFGPLTLARPLVVVGGLAFAVAGGVGAAAAALAALPVLGALILEPALGRAYRE